MNEPMPDPRHDRKLAELITDAVADVEPADRLAEIQERTAPRRTRRGWYAAGGAMLAAAAAVTAIALAANQAAPEAEEDPPIGSPTSSPTPTPGESAYAVYYVGETPMGLRLYREFQRAAGVNSLPAAIHLIESSSFDPDYRTLWQPGSFETAQFVPDIGVIQVNLADSSLRARPAGMSAAGAGLAIQQVIYTLQAAAKERHPVQFRWNGNPIDQVYGVPTSEPLPNEPILAVNSHVQLSTPDEGQTFPVNGTIHVSGAANSFEANVVWRLQRWEGTEIVARGYFTAEGHMAERLFPFVGDIKLEGIPAGRYLLSVSTDDASGEGKFFTDDRLITID